MTWKPTEWIIVWGGIKGAQIRCEWRRRWVETDDLMPDICPSQVHSHNGVQSVQGRSWTNLNDTSAGGEN